MSKSFVLQSYPYSPGKWCIAIFDEDPNGGWVGRGRITGQLFKSEDAADEWLEKKYGWSAPTGRGFAVDTQGVHPND